MGKEESSVISLRVRNGLLEVIQAEAAIDRRSRNAKLVEILEDWARGVEVGRASVPGVLLSRSVVVPLQKTTAGAADSKSVADGKGKAAASPAERVEVRKGCPECGSLAGHQRGCSRR
jgi:hypothetical protein